MSNKDDIIRALFEYAEVEIYAKGSDGRILYVNPHAVRELGAASADAVIGKKLVDFVNQEYVDELATLDTRVLDMDEPLSYKHIRHLNSTDTPVVDHKFPLDNPEFPGAIAGIAFDMSNVESRRT